MRCSGRTGHRSIDLSKLDGKRKEDLAKRRGTIVSDDLLAYTEFHQLKAIILDNWIAFGPALKKCKYVEVYLDRMGGFRNPSMHARNLVAFERSLVDGIVGEFRNLTTLYRTTMGPDMQHYPVIERVVDSFGRSTVAGNTSERPYVRVQVGQEVQFDCEGNDPQGRELTWTLATQTGSDFASVTGDRASLTWIVGKNNVMEECIIRVRMKSSGEHHHDGDYDATEVFRFAVDPPAG